MKARMPATVKKVHEAAVRSARKAGLSDTDVYTSHYTGQLSVAYNEWVVGDNLERLDGSFVYKVNEKKWYYRYKHTGDDSPLLFNEVEAIESAEIMYTG